MFSYSHFPAATDQKETLMSASRWRCLLEESQQEFCCCFNYSLPFRLTGLFKQEKKKKKKKKRRGGGEGTSYLASLFSHLSYVATRFFNVDTGDTAHTSSSKALLVRPISLGQGTWHAVHMWCRQQLLDHHANIGILFLEFIHSHPIIFF